MLGFYEMGIFKQVNNFCIFFKLKKINTIFRVTEHIIVYCSKEFYVLPRKKVYVKEN